MPCLFRHFGASFCQIAFGVQAHVSAGQSSDRELHGFAAMTEIASAFLRGNGYRGLMALRNSLELQLRARREASRRLSQAGCWSASTLSSSTEGCRSGSM